MSPRILDRVPRGLLLLVCGTVAALAIVFAAVSGGLLDLGVGAAPHVRIDAPTR